MLNRLKLPLFLFALVFAISVIIFRLLGELNIDSSILSLIGSEQSTQFIRDLSDNAANEFSQRAFFLVLDEDEENAINSAKMLKQKMQESGVFIEVSSGSTPEIEREYFNWFFSQRYSLLSDNVRGILQTEEKVEAFIQDFNRRLFAPMPDFYGENLKLDPLMLFMDKMLELRGESQWISFDGLLILPDDTTAILINATLRENSFSPQIQIELEDFIAEARYSLSSQILVVSIARFAKIGFNEGMRDATVVGGISLVFIIVMLSVVFRNAFVILISLLPIFCGLIFAFAALFLLSPQINVVAISMGACFVGVVIDYSLHYLVKNEENPQLRLKAIKSPITLSAFSTMLGFCAFLLTPLQGLQHIAIMGVFGLLGAYLTVIVLFPRIAYANKKLPFALPKNALPQAPFWLTLTIAGLVILVSILGIFRTRFNDNIQNFTNSAPVLQAEEALFSSFVQNTEANRFLAVVAPCEERLLFELAQVSISLNCLKNRGLIAGYRSISQFVVSKESARENRKNLLNLLNAGEQELQNHLRNLGFSQEVLDKLISDLTLDEFSHFTIYDFLGSPISAAFLATFIQNDTLSAALILLENIKDERAVRALENRESVFYFNRINEVTEILRKYREVMQKTIIIAMLVIFLILFGFLRKKAGVKTAVSVILVPFLTLIFTQAILGFLGVEQNLMHGVGQLLVLGIGVDYAVFRAKAQKNPNETELALLLSCLTSFMAFGLLAFANTPPLRSMGEAAALGIILSYLFSFLVQKSPREI